MVTITGFPHEFIHTVVVVKMVGMWVTVLCSSSVVVRYTV